jgi:hypothetical protein
VAHAKGRDKVDDTYGSLLCRVVDQTVDVDTLRQARLFVEALWPFTRCTGREIEDHANGTTVAKDLEAAQRARIAVGPASRRVGG